MRDTQRSKVYRAEREAFGNNFDKFGSRIEDICDIHTYITKGIAVRATIKRRYANANIEKILIRPGIGARMARGGEIGLTLPKWARCEPVILHELAHTITIRTLRDIAWHGREFCEVYLNLVHFVLGQEASEALKQAFKANNVKYRKPSPRKQRILTEDQRQELRDRMAKARAARTAKYVEESYSVTVA